MKPLIIECSKLAQMEYKTRDNWVGKVIHLELCNRWKFGLTTKWYTHKPVFFLENERHKVFWDFETQTKEYITYELVSAPLAVSCVSGSSNLDRFRDGMQVAV